MVHVALERMEGLLVLLCAFFFLFYVRSDSLTKTPASRFYSFELLDAYGQLISMEKYRGRVLLIVNVASECGYTDGHYKDLVKLRNDLGKGGFFEVLAFPCNQFGGQEPKDSTEVLRFAKENYGLNFPVFKKINVIDSDVPDLWRYLQENTGKVPTWNFWKYLVDSRGAVVNAWGPWTGIQQIYSEIKDAVTAAERPATASFRHNNEL